MKHLHLRFAEFGLCLALLMASPQARATVTIFSSYNFENISTGNAFYGDSSGHGHGMTGGTFAFASDASHYPFTSSNLASTGGNYAFDGSLNAENNYAYDVNSSVGQAINWGFELLVKNPGSNNSGATTIFSVGNPNSNGLAIYYDPVADQLYGRVSGGATFGNTSFAHGAWNSVAVVNNGVNTTLWLNYAAVGSVAVNPSAPDTSWHMFVNPGGSSHYTGLADNINVFTFTGGFAAADLSAGAIPEPADYAALCGLAGLMLAFVRTRAKRARTG